MLRLFTSVLIAAILMLAAPSAAQHLVLRKPVLYAPDNCFDFYLANVQRTDAGRLTDFNPATGAVTLTAIAARQGWVFDPNAGGPYQNQEAGDYVMGILSRYGGNWYACQGPATMVLPAWAQAPNINPPPQPQPPDWQGRYFILRKSVFGAPPNCFEFYLADGARTDAGLMVAINPITRVFEPTAYAARQGWILDPAAGGPYQNREAADYVMGILSRYGGNWYGCEGLRTMDLPDWVPQPPNPVPPVPGPPGVITGYCILRNPDLYQPVPGQPVCFEFYRADCRRSDAGRMCWIDEIGRCQTTDYAARQGWQVDPNRGGPFPIAQQLAASAALGQLSRYGGDFYGCLQRISDPPQPNPVPPPGRPPGPDPVPPPGRPPGPDPIQPPERQPEQGPGCFSTRVSVRHLKSGRSGFATGRIRFEKFGFRFDLVNNCAQTVTASGSCTVNSGIELHGRQNKITFKKRNVAAGKTSRRFDTYMYASETVGPATYACSGTVEIGGQSFSWKDSGKP